MLWRNKRKTFLLLVLLLLATLTRIPPASSQTETWLEGWDHRKLISITSSVGAGTNYQINMTLAYDGSTQSDFGDLRFTDNDGETLLDYWVEEMIDADFIDLWVEVRDDLSTEAQEIYMYYGNIPASYPYETDELEHGENTFRFFDDFEDASIDAGKWVTQTDANIAVTETGGYLYVLAHDTHSPTVFGGARATISAVGLNFTMRFNAEFGAGGSHNGGVMVGFMDSSAWGITQIENASILFEKQLIGDDFHYLSTREAGSETDTGTASNLGTKRDYEIRRTPTDTVLTWGDVVKATSNNDLTTASIYSAFEARKGSGSGNVWVKSYWTLLRRFVDPEPVATLGAEEDPSTYGPQYPVWFPLVFRLLGILAPFVWMGYEFTNIKDFKSGLKAVAVTFVGFILFIVMWYIAGGLEEVIMQYD